MIQKTSDCKRLLGRDRRQRRKAYSYLRFSAAEQAGGHSLKRQTALAADYARRHNLDLDEALTFRDLGVSAYRGLNAETGQLAALLEAVRAGLIPPKSVILVENLDRISRQTARKALRVIESIVEMNVSIVTLTDEREYTVESLDEDPLNLLVALLTFIRANEESALKSRRLKAWWAEKRALAPEKPISRMCPGWIQVTSDGNRFKLVPERATVVRHIFNEALRGHGSLFISRSLNAERVPLFSSFGRTGKMWAYGNISQLLRNPSVMGTYVPHRIEYKNGKKFRVPSKPIENYYPAVVSKSTFDRVQAIREKAATNPRRRQAFPAYNIIGRIGRCPHCYASLSRISISSHASYLVCRAAYMNMGCHYETVRYAEVENSIFLELRNELNGGRFSKRGMTKSVIAQFDAILNAHQIDRPALNKLLILVLHSVIVLRDRRMIQLDWKNGTKSLIRDAFTLLK